LNSSPKIVREIKARRMR